MTHAVYREKEAPRVVRTEIARIKSDPEWKRIEVEDTAALRSQFDRLPKNEIRQSLLEEQHELCAYCMKRIVNEELHTTIEHWAPLSKDKNNALDYHNFLAVCKGGADVPGEARRRVLCCDASKGDAEITIDPRDRDMMSHIIYKKDGSMEFKPRMPSGRWMPQDIEKINQDIDNVLHLNGRPNRHGGVDDTATCVVKGRKDAWEAGTRIVKELHKKGVCTSQKLQRVIERLQDASPREPFVGVTIYYLQRKRRQLMNQKPNG